MLMTRRSVLAALGALGLTISNRGFRVGDVVRMKPFPWVTHENPPRRGMLEHPTRLTVVEPGTGGRVTMVAWPVSGGSFQTPLPTHWLERV